MNVTLLPSRRCSDVPSLMAHLLVFVLPGIVLVVYWPSMSGGFFLDDFFNLEALYSTAPFENFKSVLKAATENGIASSIGRPLSLLTFFLDSLYWPAEPYHFKLTNLLFHAINALLVFWLFSIIIVHFGGRYSDSFLFISFFAALLWALHPLHVSTVAYVIQRMTLLSATFSLLALILYFKSTVALIYGRKTRSIFLLLICFFISYPASILSKENGALLPFYIFLINLILFRGDKRIKHGMRNFRAFFLIHWALISGLVFSILVFAFLSLESFQSIYEERRDFTMYERVLTQPRVLVEYIYLFIIPHAHTVGASNEAYAISTGLFSPPQTFLSIMLVLALVFGSFFIREKMPLLALSVLFFFCGHLVESTVIPLEIYFEHRNYLPTVFLSLPIVCILSQLTISKKTVLSCALFFILCIIAFMRASLWGDPVRLKQVWAAENPLSGRTQLGAVNAWVRINRPEQAERQLNKALETATTYRGQLVLARLVLKCRFYGSVEKRIIEDTLGVLARERPSNYEYARSMASILEMVEHGRCSIKPGETLLILNQIISRLEIKENIEDFLFMRARIQVLLKDYPAALSDFIESIRLGKDCEKLILAMSSFGSNSVPVYGLDLINSISKEPGISICERAVKKGNNSDAINDSMMHEFLEMQSALQEDAQ